MVDPLFWLGLSILFVAVSLAAVLVAALPALRELARAARSAEKLFDTLSRELPPTLEAIRLTGMEITELTDDVSDGVQSAGRVVKQVDQSISGAKKQARQASVTTRSVMVGLSAAWKTFNRKAGSSRRSTPERLPSGSTSPVNFEERYSRESSSVRQDAFSEAEYGDFDERPDEDVSSYRGAPSTAASEPRSPQSDSSVSNRRNDLNDSTHSSTDALNAPQPPLRDRQDHD